MRLGLVVFCVGLVWAQDDVPVFRTGTRLVQVDVVVRDKNGPITDLVQGDFEVTDNGKRQQISIFSIRKVDPAAKAAALPPGVYSSRPQQRGAEPVSATVVLIDRINTFVEDQGYARIQALKYIQRAMRNEQIALYELGNTLRVMQQFTDDRDLLYSAMDKSKMEQSSELVDQPGTGILAGVTGNAAQAIRANSNVRRADITTAAFVTIARQLEGLPGRKKLIWITAALPLTFTLETERNGVTLQEYSDLSPQLYKAMKILNDSNVALYPIDPRGVFPGVLSDPGITAMIRLSELTGGKPYYADNDISNGMEEAIADTDVTYTLGYYPAEDLQDGAFHDIKVKVARPGLEVRSRRGFTAAKPLPMMTEKQRKATLRFWVHEPVSATGLGIVGVARKAPDRPGYYAVELALNPTELKLELKNGRWVGAFDIAVVPNKGNKPKGLEQRINVNLSPDRYAAPDASFLVRNIVKMTDKKGKLIAPEMKAVIMDAATGKAGSIVIPLQ